MGRDSPDSTRRAHAPLDLGDVLFTRAQRRVLGLLFGQPRRSFRSCDLIRFAKSGTGAAHRLLTRLAEARVVTVETIGNSKRYRANRGYPAFAELCGLVRKTFGLVGPLQECLAPLAERIDAAFVYGIVADGAERGYIDIDLIVISDEIEFADLFGVMWDAEAKLARRINPRTIKPAEWRRDCSKPGTFAASLERQRKLFVIGSAADLCWVERYGAARRRRA